METMMLKVYISGCIFFGVIAGIFSDKIAAKDISFEVFLFTVFWPVILAVGVAWGIIFVPYFIGRLIRRVLKKSQRKEAWNDTQGTRRII